MCLRVGSSWGRASSSMALMAFCHVRGVGFHVDAPDPESSFGAGQLQSRCGAEG